MYPDRRQQKLKLPTLPANRVWLKVTCAENLFSSALEQGVFQTFSNSSSELKEQALFQPLFKHSMRRTGFFPGPIRTSLGPGTLDLPTEFFLCSQCADPVTRQGGQ